MFATRAYLVGSVVTIAFMLAASAVPARDRAAARTSDACALVMDGERPIAAIPAAGAWTPTLSLAGNDLWVAFADHRNATRYGDAPDLFVRRYDARTGAPQGADFLAADRGVQGGVAWWDGAPWIVFDDGNDSAGLARSRIGRNGPERSQPFGERSQARLPVVTGGAAGGLVVWASGDHGVLRARTMRMAASRASLTLSRASDPPADRVRALAVEGGFVVVWTLADSIEVARLRADQAGALQPVWRTSVPFADRLLELGELGEPGIVGDEVVAPVLGHPRDACLPATYLVHVSLAGDRRPEVAIPDQPFFAANAHASGVTLLAVDEANHAICVSRWSAAGASLAPRTCSPYGSLPDVPLEEDEYRFASHMHAATLWAGEHLYVATLDADGMVVPTLRRFSCAGAP